MKQWPYIAIIIVLGILLMQKQCSSDRKFKQLRLEADADLVAIKLKNGQELSKMVVSESTYRNQVARLKDQNDSLSLQLLEAIRRGKRPQSATVINTVTEVTKEIPVHVTYRDTINRNDTIYVYPEYSAEHHDEFVDISITANKDTLINLFRVINKMDVTWHRSRKGWEIAVLNRNPYTHTEDIKSWTIEQREKRFGLGISAGYGVSVINGKIGLGPQVGISLNYSIIKF